jgi:hypothetical protein
MGGEERKFLSLRSLGLTEAERGSADSYRGGEVVRFHQNVQGFTRGERVTVTGIHDRKVSVTYADGRKGTLPLNKANQFEVYSVRTLPLAAGDRFRITQNGFTREVMRGGRPAKSRLNNGDMLDVAGFTAGGDILATNGFVIPKDYGGLAQGYVVTSHGSQGATVDRVLIALGHESLAAANRQQFYVSVSRGREAVRLYTDDKAALIEAVKGDASRLSATELLRIEAKKAVAGSDGVARLVRMHRAGRLHKAWRERAAHAIPVQPHREAQHGRH